MIIFYFWVAVLVIRLSSLGISIKNEKKLKANGAKEYGKNNTRNLTFAHIAFYLGLLIETIYKPYEWDIISNIGLGIYIFSILILVIVITGLGKFWTVKLIIAKDHQVVKSWFFRTFKHPNYYLNILPELLGLTLLFHSFITPAVVLPFYLFCLIKRVKEEETIMKNSFSEYN